MDDEETISVNDFVESLPTENRKNYPIQLESSNKIEFSIHREERRGVLGPKLAL